MSIQAIIDSAQTIEFDRRKIVGQTVSRSQRIKTAERASAQPFKLTVTPPAFLRYSTNRDLIEAIQSTDRNNEVQINLANNTKMAYLTAYQGRLNNTQLNALTITNFTTSTVTIGGLPGVASSTVVFQPGDFIQPENSRYPYIVTNTVTRGTGSVVTATVHRPAILSEGISLNTGIKVGTSCTMQVVVATLPTYEVVPHDRLQFKSEFVLVEKII